MQELLLKLKEECITEEENFSLLKDISLLLNSNDEQNKEEARNALIIVLDNFNKISARYKGIWNDLIEAAGFYPYLKEEYFQSFDSQIRNEYHKSDYMNITFHSEQKKLSDMLLSGENVIVSAPTSFGKSLLIEEIVASGIYKNIVIIQPTLALLDETRNKLKKYGADYKLIVKTSQRPSELKGNLFLLTAERVVEYEEMPQIDLLILDEFYKLSSQREDNRAAILNNAFIKIIKKYNAKFYLLGPNIDSISMDFARKYNAKFFRTNYSLVYNNEINKVDKNFISRKRVKEEYLFKILEEQRGQTLVFCSSPSRARTLSFAYARYKREKGGQTISLPIFKWIEENINKNWTLKHALSYRIGVHDGALPRHISSSIIEYFNEGKLDYLFCTNTIIEGVNTSAKNVVFYDNKIGNRDVDYFDYANIKGRAGRLMEHYVGNIINLQEPPQKENIVIDIPFCDQNPIELEVLVNLEEDEVKDINDNKVRYEDFSKNDDELKRILKKNGVSISAQLKILEQIERISTTSRFVNFYWKGFPNYSQLLPIIELCWDDLSTKEEKTLARTPNKLTYKALEFAGTKSLKKMIDNEYDYFKKQNKELFDDISNKTARNKDIEKIRMKIDDIVLYVFSLHRKWFQYKLPKWLSIINSLVNYVGNKSGLGAVDYSYFADMLENDFVSPNLRILIEYGVPTTAIQKIDMHKYSELTEEEVMEELKKDKELLKNILSEYEFNALSRCL